MKLISRHNSVLITSCFILLFLNFSISPSTQAQDGNGQITEAVYKNLRFREIGPAIMGGRIDDFAVVENQTNIVYVGAASGGVWKTINHGVTWEPIFDNEAVSTIGDVTVAPSDPNIVWVGTGEANNRQSSSWGNGVHKSMDGGKTWSHMGLKDTHHIGRIVIDPANPNLAYVAAAGHLWGPNKDRGLYKTTDGGKTWVNTKFINEDTGFIDVAMDPESSQTLYAAAYQRRRTASGFNGGGPHSGLYKTTDGGASWTKLTQGLPEGDTGRIGIDIYRKDPRIVYAIIENAKGGVFRSEDRGLTWKKMSDTNPRPTYYSQIRIDPNNDQRIWVLGASMYVSEDGGKTFATNVVTKIHGDYHALWVDPANSNHMLAGSDGGIHISWDRGRTWDYVNSLALGQFYEVGVDMRKPYWVYGGLQDNGSWGAPSNTLFSQGISNEDWIRIGGGDGFYAQVDPSDPDIIYTESQNGNVQRLHMKTRERRVIRPEPKPGDPPHRFDWNTPIFISPHNSKTIYYGGNRLFKSTDRGDTWTASEDLTTKPERDKMPIMGVVPGKDTLSRHDGQESYGQILTISESPLKEGILWVGTDDGNVQVSRDGGKTLKNVVEKIAGVPKNTYVSRVVASKSGEGAAYVTFDGHRSNDFAPYAFMTTDYGESWKSITGNLPAGHSISVLREHPRNANLLFVGTEFGAFVSFNKGSSWLRLKNNVPTAPVDDIAIHPRENDLIFGTHGRSIWILDDITPLEQLNESVIASDLFLFDMRTATMFRIYGHKGNTGHKFFLGPNPPNGAVVHYYLKTKPKDPKEEVKVTILDKTGKIVIRELKGAKEEGINRVSWDLRHKPPVEPEPEQPRGFFGPPEGPRVLPGEYMARVSLGSQSVNKTIKVEEDPRIEVNPADRQKQFDALMTVSKLYSSADAARKTTQSLRSQLNSMQESLKKIPNAPASLTTAAEELGKKVEEVQKGLVQSSGGESAGPPLPGTPIPVITRLRRLLSAIDGFTAAPTSPQMEQLQQLSLDVKKVVGQVNELVERSVPDLNKRLKDANIPYVNPGEKIVTP